MSINVAHLLSHSVCNTEVHFTIGDLVMAIVGNLIAYILEKTVFSIVYFMVWTIKWTIYVIIAVIAVAYLNR